MTRGSMNHQAQPQYRNSHGAAVVLEEKATMKSLRHWLTELNTGLLGGFLYGEHQQSVHDAYQRGVQDGSQRAQPPR